MKKWLEGLEPPDIKRRIEIMENLLPETGGVEGAKRTVRARNPRPRGSARATCAGGTVTSRSRTI